MGYTEGIIFQEMMKCFANLLLMQMNVCFVICIMTTRINLLLLPGNINSSMSVFWSHKGARRNTIFAVTLAVITPYYICADTRSVMADHTWNLKCTAKLYMARFRFPNWWLDL